MDGDDTHKMLSRNKVIEGLPKTRINKDSLSQPDRAKAEKRQHQCSRMFCEENTCSQRAEPSRYVKEDELTGRKEEPAMSIQALLRDPGHFIS